MRTRTQRSFTERKTPDQILKDFMAVAKPVPFVVYGVPTDELKKTLADFHPVYMTPFDGFTK